MRQCEISPWIWQHVREYDRQIQVMSVEYPIYAGSIPTDPSTVGKTAYAPRRSAYRIGINNSEIKAEAVKLVRTAASNYQQDPDQIWNAVWRNHMDLIPQEPTWPQGTEDHGRRERTINIYFWRRIIRKTIREAREIANLKAGRIGQKNIYVSADGMRDRQEQSQDLIGFLSRSYIMDTLTGELITMADKTQMQERTQARLLNRVNGVQDYADLLGLRAYFVTLTVPPRMHPNPTAGKSSWDGTTPKEAQTWIAERWAKVQRKIQKAGVEWTYLRSVEPHKDGCPHWHIVIWTRPENMDTIWPKKEDEKIILGRIEEEFRRFWPVIQGIGKLPNEKNTTNTRAMKIETATKSAPAYIWKYILKNTGGNPGEESSAARVDAWRSMWRIYAFRFGGTLIPTGAIGQFDELRQALNRPQDDTTGKLWDAAQAGDFGQFLQICKGQKLIKYMMIPKVNQYGETIFKKFGLEDAKEMIISRDPGRYKIISSSCKPSRVNCFQEAKALSSATDTSQRQRDIAKILVHVRDFLEMGEFLEMG